MDNFLVLILVAAIVGLSARYVYRARKRGVKCVGCPDAKTCSGSCGCCETK